MPILTRSFPPILFFWWSQRELDGVHREHLQLGATLSAKAIGIMTEAARMLEQLEVPFEMEISSAKSSPPCDTQ